MVVVDNGSTDETCDIVRRSFPEALVLSGHGNIGFGRACNLGAEHATFEHLLFLNPDAVLVSADPDELRVLFQEPNFGALSAMLVEAGAPARPTLREHSRHWLVELIATQVLAILSPLAPRPRYVERAQKSGVYTASGAALLLATEEFRELGGFDERFFMYYEDTDLSQRYLRRGDTLRSSDALVATHLGGVSAPTARRLALSFLGWVEYTNKWNGRRSAKRAAETARLIFSTLIVLLGLSGRFTHSRRLSAKADQLSEMVSAVALGGTAGDPRETHIHYPAASAITSRRFRSRTDG